MVRIPGEALVANRGVHHRSSATDSDRPLVGVLALQGDVLENLRMLSAAGAQAVACKRPAELEAVDGLVIPGGESTTIGKLAVMYGLLDPLRQRMRAGMPAFGTCAGAILLASKALHADGRPADQPLLAAMDTVVRRNAFGRQVASFEADIDVKGLPGRPLHAIFIRAPWIEEHGPAVEVLAKVGTPLGDKVVVARQGNLLASAFHPELTDDSRLHALFVDIVREAATV